MYNVDSSLNTTNEFLLAIMENKLVTTCLGLSSGHRQVTTLL